MKTLLLHRCQWFTNHTVTMQLGRNFGISPAKTIWIMDIALPVMIAAMAKIEQVLDLGVLTPSFTKN